MLPVMLTKSTAGSGTLRCGMDHAALDTVWYRGHTHALYMGLLFVQAYLQMQGPVQNELP